MMTVIITLFSIPIGLTLAYFEHKRFDQYEAIFHDFFSLLDRSEISIEEKKGRAKAMLEHNSYVITKLDSHEVVGEKKLFSPGWQMFWLGFAMVGAFIYIFYFYKLKKPHIVRYRLDH